jgi:hypothetical protein
MPGRDNSAHQRKIIQGYYEHADTIALQKLGEAVSELYLAHGNKAEKLWATARTALLKLVPMEDPRLINVLRTRSVTALAELVSQLSAAPAKNPQSSSGPQRSEKGPDAGAMPAIASGGHATERADGSRSDDADHVAGADVTPERLRSAMKAFRKRLKLTRLDEESKISGGSHNPLSSGKKSTIVAILPPREFPAEVWEELARQGQLKSTGGGFYKLASD